MKMTSSSKDRETIERTNMKIIKVQSGQVIAKKNDKVKYWYLVQEGTEI